MLPLPLLRKLGVYVDEDFLSAETCGLMLPQLKASQSSSAPVASDGNLYVNEKSRKTQLLTPSTECREIMQNALEGISSKLENFFRLQLRKKEEPQFLRYRKGDFFTPHTDADLIPGSPDYQRRKVSVVSFLNSAANDASRVQENYQGGELVLYGLLKAKKSGLPLRGRSGLLLAFPSDLMHEVNPVIAGERYSVVTWFH